jgi:hypothetical protein
MNLRAVAVGFCPLNSTFWPILTEGIIIVLLSDLVSQSVVVGGLFDYYRLST